MTLTPEQKAEGWIEHGGKGCPVPDYAECEVMWRGLADDYTSEGIARVFGWDAVRAYREPKP